MTVWHLAVRCRPSTPLRAAVAGHGERASGGL